MTVGADVQEIVECPYLIDRDLLTRLFRPGRVVSSLAGIASHSSEAGCSRRRFRVVPLPQPATGEALTTSLSASPGLLAEQGGGKGNCEVRTCRSPADHTAGARAAVVCVAP